MLQLLSQIASIGVPLAQSFLSSRRQDELAKRMAEAQRHANLVNLLSRGRVQSNPVVKAPKKGLLENLLGATNIGLQAANTYQQGRKADKLFKSQMTNQAIKEAGIIGAGRASAALADPSLTAAEIVPQSANTSNQTIKSATLEAMRNSPTYFGDIQREGVDSNLLRAAAHAGMAPLQQQAFQNELASDKLTFLKEQQSNSLARMEQDAKDKTEKAMADLAETVIDRGNKLSAVEKYKDLQAEVAAFRGYLDTYFRLKDEGRDVSAVRRNLIASGSRIFSDEALQAADVENIDQARSWADKWNLLKEKPADGGLMSDDELRSMAAIAQGGVDKMQTLAFSSVDRLMAAYKIDEPYQARIYAGILGGKLGLPNPAPTPKTTAGASPSGSSGGGATAAATALSDYINATAGPTTEAPPIPAPTPAPRRQDSAPAAPSSNLFQTLSSVVPDFQGALQRFSARPSRFEAAVGPTADRLTQRFEGAGLLQPEEGASIRSGTRTAARTAEAAVPLVQGLAEVARRSAPTLRQSAAQGLAGPFAGALPAAIRTGTRAASTLAQQVPSFQDVTAPLSGFRDRMLTPTVTGTGFRTQMTPEEEEFHRRRRLGLGLFR